MRGAARECAEQWEQGLTPLPLGLSRALWGGDKAAAAAANGIAMPGVTHSVQVSFVSLLPAPRRSSQEMRERSSSSAARPRFQMLPRCVADIQTSRCAAAADPALARCLLQDMRSHRSAARSPLRLRCAFV